jgi:hypothetical protein
MVAICDLSTGGVIRQERELGRQFVHYAVNELLPRLVDGSTSHESKVEGDPTQQAVWQSRRLRARRCGGRSRATRV